MLHRKAESVCLPPSVVGILADDYHLYPVERCGIQGVEDKGTGGVNRVGLFLFQQEGFEVAEGIGLESVPERLFPSGFQPGIDGFHGMKLLKSGGIIKEQGGG